MAKTNIDDLLSREERAQLKLNPEQEQILEEIVRNREQISTAARSSVEQLAPGILTPEQAQNLFTQISTEDIKAREAAGQAVDAQQITTIRNTLQEQPSTPENVFTRSEIPTAAELVTNQNAANRVDTIRLTPEQLGTPAAPQQRAPTQQENNVDTLFSFADRWSKINREIANAGKGALNMIKKHPKTSIVLGSAIGYGFKGALAGLVLANPLAASALGVGALASYIAYKKKMSNAAKVGALATAGIGAAALFPVAVPTLAFGGLAVAAGPKILRWVAEKISGKQSATTGTAAEVSGGGRTGASRSGTLGARLRMAS